MLKILVPVDGAATAQQAVEHVAKLYRNEAKCEIHLLNVQRPIESGHARMLVSHGDIEAYQREDGGNARANACRHLDETGVPYQHHIVVGHVAETISRYAKERRFDKIVMGTHNHSALLPVLLGSMAQDVLKHSAMPVTVVKPLDA